MSAPALGRMMLFDPQNRNRPTDRKEREAIQTNYPFQVGTWIIPRGATLEKDNRQRFACATTNQGGHRCNKTPSLSSKPRCTNDATEDPTT